MTTLDCSAVRWPPETFHLARALSCRYNKYLLAYGGFPYPIALTMWHMFFCASLAIGLVKSGKVQSINMERETYIK
jgi:hypothetical protein